MCAYYNNYVLLGHYYANTCIALNWVAGGLLCHSSLCRLTWVCSACIGSSILILRGFFIL